MTNPTQQPLHRHTHTHSPGDLGCLQVRDPVWLPCLWAYYQADFPHVITMQRKFTKEEGRKPTGSRVVGRAEG